jgi:hypothetical protein
MATTPNYGWVMPDPTDFVTSLPADFEIFGDAADASVKALNPGTTAGDVDYYTSGTAKARLGIGTAGQVLTVNSGATAPQWSTPSSGGFTVIASGTLSAAGILSVTSIPQIYRNLVFILKNPRYTSNEPIGLQQNSVSSNYFGGVRINISRNQMVWNIKTL